MECQVSQVAYRAVGYDRCKLCEEDGVCTERAFPIVACALFHGTTGRNMSFFFVLFVVFLPKWCTGTGTRLAHIYTLQIALVSVKYGTGIYIVSVDLNTRATATGCIKRAEVSNMQTCWSTSLKLSTLIYVHSTMEGAPSTHVEQCPQ